MNRHSFDISRIHRLALVLCGLALCMMALPFLQPLPTGKPTADEVAYPIRNYPLDDPHTVRDYDGVVGRLEPTGIEFVRPRCRGERGERFLFAWLPSFTDGVVVTGYRANDPAAALAVTGFVLKNSGPAAYYRIRDTRHSELPAWDWSAVANGFRRSLSPQRGATNKTGAAPTGRAGTSNGATTGAMPTSRVGRPKAMSRKPNWYGLASGWRALARSTTCSIERTTSI